MFCFKFTGGNNYLIQICTIINEKTAIVLNVNLEAPISVIVPTDLVLFLHDARHDARHEKHAQLEKL